MVVLVARQLLSSRRLVIGRFPHAICITIEYSDEDAQLLCINISFRREVLEQLWGYEEEHESEIHPVETSRGRQPVCCLLGDALRPPPRLPFKGRRSTREVGALGASHHD